MEWGPTERIQMWMDNECVPRIGESDEQQRLFEEDLRSVLGGKSAIKWLLEEIVLPNWTDSLPVIIESFEDMEGCPEPVLSLLREMAIAEGYEL